MKQKLEKEIENIREDIVNIQKEAKKFTMTQLISKDTPLGTIAEFLKNKNIYNYHASVVTVYKIAKKVDLLNNRETQFAKEFEKKIKKLIKNYILIDTRNKLKNKYNLNMETLTRIYKFNIRTTYINLSTLIKYAEKICGDE